MEPPANARELDDVSLSLARRGDERACRRLVEIYERAVFALLSRLLLSHRALVEDLAQETFLRVFRALPGFVSDGPARLSTWILTIATRLALDELKRRRPASAPFELAARVPTAGDPERRLDDGRLRRALEAALAELPAEQRAVFVLREHHELAYEEIARSLEVDVGTVKSRLFRARTSLRARLMEVRDAL